MAIPAKLYHLAEEGVILQDSLEKSTVCLSISKIMTMHQKPVWEIELNLRDEKQNKPVSL